MALVATTCLWKTFEKRKTLFLMVTLNLAKNSRFEGKFEAKIFFREVDYKLN